MPLEASARIVQELTSRGYNAEREAVTLIAGADHPALVLEATVEAAPADALKLTAEHVRAGLSEVEALADDAAAGPGVAAAADASTDGSSSADATPTADASADSSPDTDHAGPTDADPSVSTGNTATDSPDGGREAPPETKGVDAGADAASTTSSAQAASSTFERSGDASRRSLAVKNDMTGESTGTGEYSDFVAVFRDRYDKLAGKLRGRVNHRPADAIDAMPGGSDVAMVGMVNDIRSTASGHWLVELEDTTGTFPFLVMKDRDFAELVDELLLDEVVAMEGTLADDAGIAFTDAMHFPDVPRTYQPSTADRHVQAALVSDVHVGSQEFVADAWGRFADWLHTEQAQHVEYLLVAGDMVEGVGVYPDQDEELDIVDIYDQYEAFAEHLKAVPGDMEIVMIPGNHDAVRLAEPQPGFDDELRDIMSAHDARIVSNPAMVDVEGVSFLLYHGVSLDEVIAELPEEKASYDEPQRAMYQLLKKRHVAPQYGGKMRMAPEDRDYLVMDEVPDVFHTGHVHKLGYGKYHNVLAINSGCWQAQTAFQKSVNIDPDVAYAPIVDLDTLDVTIRKFI